eukprot:CAMPEP_0205805298 /NCGR_PEP_ID=MMETSP0205-20121125/8484_1 /ASSEMBLY_ACC=CAM_ASM_000278 /TAXON_ID=36767 /ORGANISM="Euplotes focardii, Strain TN1" /LENGTH=196 /DNA_ID=CAMNT_0053076301 /DNA_START=242 /DNA_END=833 /DNA_ORIENTATION=-
MTETNDKLKNTTKQLERIINENKEEWKEYLELEEEKLKIVEEQNKLIENIEELTSKNAGSHFNINSIANSSLEVDDNYETYDFAQNQVKYKKSVNQFKNTQAKLGEKLRRNEMEGEDLNSMRLILEEHNNEHIDEDEEDLEYLNELHELGVSEVNPEAKFYYLLHKDKELTSKIEKLQPILKDLMEEIDHNDKNDN